MLGAALVITLVAAAVGCVSAAPAGAPRTIAPPRPPATPPPTTVLTRVLRVYPSAKLVPISNPYLFYWDFGPPPDFAGAVADAEGAGDAAQQASALREHRLPVFWTSGPQWPDGRSKKEFVDYYLGSIAPYRAFMIDEWQGPDPTAPAGSPLAIGNPYGIEGAIEGIELARERHPGSLVLIAWRGEDSLLPLVRADAVDYLLIEAYTNVMKSVNLTDGISIAGVDQRIEKARSWGVVDRTVPWLGHFVPDSDYHPGHALTVEELQRQIRHYRAIAPEMPGLAFFGGAANLALAKAASELAVRYFVAPAPEIRIVSPSDGAILSRAPHLIVARASAREGRSVAEYRGFIDNRLVYDGSNPAFTWDFSGESPGPHTITMQAYDSGWNRAATQIDVHNE